MDNERRRGTNRVARVQVCLIGPVLSDKVERGQGTRIHPCQTREHEREGVCPQICIHLQSDESACWKDRRRSWNIISNGTQLRLHFSFKCHHDVTTIQHFSSRLSCYPRQNMWDMTLEQVENYSKSSNNCLRKFKNNHCEHCSRESYNWKLWDSKISMQLLWQSSPRG